MNAASDSNFSRPGSTTAHHPVQDTALSYPPESSSNVAGNLNPFEMPYQYTWPKIAISIAQQEAMYLEKLHAQLQQTLSDQRVEHEHSPSDSGVVDHVNQASADVQNVALPQLQLPMQLLRPPTPVMPPLNSNIFVPEF